MRRSETRQGRLPLSVSGIAHVWAPLPEGREREFVAPASWLDGQVEERFKATTIAIRNFLPRLTGGGDGEPRHPDTSSERSISEALVKDRAAAIDVVGALIAHRLITSYRALGRGESKRRPMPEVSLRMAAHLAGDLLKDGTYFSKLARWIVTAVSAWAPKDSEMNSSVIARRIAYLVSVHSEESAGAIAEILSPPNRPIEYLEGLLGVRDLPPDSVKIPPIPSGTMVVLATGHFQGLREALYKNTFQHVEGTPWPTALLDKEGGRGYAQLRPAVMDSEPLLPISRVEAWAQTMWKQQSELSDLDADSLDALCALYLRQARDADDAAVANVDEILAMRGLKPKRGGQGRRGGYEPEQRAEMLRALSHIQNLWIDIGEVKIYERDGRGHQRHQTTVKTLQSRPFIITDRMGQVRLDGYMDVERFVFRPGRAFAAFLFGSGRHTGLLFQKALQYDPVRRKWEKRLTRYLSWQWRAVAQGGDFSQTYTVTQLLEAVGEPLNQRYPAKTRARLEKALDILKADQVIDGWLYSGWDATSLAARGWIEKWLEATVRIEAPTHIAKYYADAELTENSINPLSLGERPLGQRLKTHRKSLGLSQHQVAARFGVQQGYLSKIEAGRSAPSLKLRREIESWLSE